MPFAVTHILVPLLLVAIIRDFYINKKNKKFSLHYVLIAGLGGILPDIDVAFFWVLYFFGFSFEQIHKTALHSIFIPLLFLILFLVMRKVNVRARICNIGRHRLKLSIIFLMLCIGSFFHLIMDMFFEPFALFYPLYNLKFGVILTTYLPNDLQWLVLPSLDAFFLIIWLLYLEFKHKISDFI